LAITDPLGPPAVLELIAAGQLPAEKVGRMWIVEARDARAFKKLLARQSRSTAQAEVSVARRAANVQQEVGKGVQVSPPLTT
jgi:hypothetical protein